MNTRDATRRIVGMPGTDDVEDLFEDDDDGPCEICGCDPEECDCWPDDDADDDFDDDEDEDE